MSELLLDEFCNENEISAGVSTSGDVSLECLWQLVTIFLAGRMPPGTLLKASSR